MELIEIGRLAKEAEPILRKLSTAKKNEVLERAASYLEEGYEELISANDLDMKAAKENNYLVVFHGSLDFNSIRSIPYFLISQLRYAT